MVKLKNKMNTYDDIKTWYKDNINYLSVIEEKFNIGFDIPNCIIKDTICKMILETKYSLKNKPIFKSFFVYYLVLLYFLFMSLFGLKDKSKTKRYHIVYDVWNIEAYKFYDVLYEYLKDFNSAFLIIPNYDKNIKNKIPKYYNNIIFDAPTYNILYLKKLSFKIFKLYFFNFFKLYRLSKKIDFDFITIVLRILRQISIHELHINKFRSNVLVSAHDNGFNALKYFIYKKNTGSIFLIQNGYRQGTTSNCIYGDCFTYCDFYIGYNQENILIQKGMVALHKFAWGSVLIDNKLKEFNTKQNNKKIYDVVFLEQFIPKDGYGISQENYELCIDFLCKFSLEYPEYKIAYRVRQQRDLIHDNDILTLLKRYEKKLNSSNIMFDDNHIMSSYDIIYRTDVIVYYASTLGNEALAFNKKVLNVYFDNKELPVVFSQKNELGMLVDNNYDLFEEKLLYLLKNNNKIIDDYYNLKREQKMNQQKDLNQKLAKLIIETLNTNEIKD